MEKEAFDTIVALNKKLEGTENLDDFGKTVFGLLLIGSVRILGPEKANELDFIDLTKNIINEYTKDYRYYHDENHIMNMLSTLHRHEYNQLDEEDGIALTLAIIYHDIVLKYGSHVSNEELSAKRFLSDFGLDEKNYHDVNEWDNNSIVNKVIYLIKATAKSPWDFSYSKGHPVSIILDTDWSRFETLKNARISNILIKEEVKTFGYGEEVYKDSSKAFFKNIIEKHKDVKDKRIENIKIVYEL